MPEQLKDIRLLKPVSRATLRKRAKAAKLHHYLEVCRLVDAREHECCRVCGRHLSEQGFLDRKNHHHIRYRSRGGLDSTQNVVLLCAIDHNHVHNGLLTITGNADLQLTFTREGRTWQG